MANMLHTLALAALSFSPLAYAQQAGGTEAHPGLTTQYCTKNGGCTTQKTSVVLDSGSHYIEEIKTGGNCLTSSGGLNSTICPTAAKCAKNCEIQAITDYASHGVTTKGDSMTLKMYLNGQSVSPRVYLLDPSGKQYDMIKLLGQEIAFDADVSDLPCGMNGALYLSQMDASGGGGKLNPAGAAYGTGYCDAQCFNTSAFINGAANVNHLGACCAEMDLWEANAEATAYTPHTCSKPGFYECSGDECAFDGICDKNGCGFNPYALGKKHYYGYKDHVDTSKPFTVVTQFVTDDGTTTGTLNEIRRLYVQNGKVIPNAVVNFQDGTINSLVNPYCSATASGFSSRGGLAGMGQALGDGMVLIFSIWNDAGGYMNWLDSGSSGPCGPKEGMPSKILKKDPGTSVTFSNVKWGDIGSTY